MTYQPGTYARELTEGHRNGEHTEPHNDCPVCYPEEDPPNEEVADLARYLQRYVDEHERGEHDAAPNLHCCECARKLGERL